MNLGLDIPAIEKMPGGEVMRLVRDILNDEAFRIATFEDQLVKHGLGGGLLNAERVAVVRAIGASSDAITLVLAQAQDDRARAADGRPEPPAAIDARKARATFTKQIANQMRAALLTDDSSGEGADHDGAAP
jgi:hypothetical protein